MESGYISVFCSDNNYYQFDINDFICNQINFEKNQEKIMMKYLLNNLE